MKIIYTLHLVYTALGKGVMTLTCHRCVKGGVHGDKPLRHRCTFPSVSHRRSEKAPMIANKSSVHTNRKHRDTCIELSSHLRRPTRQQTNDAPSDQTTHHDGCRPHMSRPFSLTTSAPSQLLGQMIYF